MGYQGHKGQNRVRGSTMKIEYFGDFGTRVPVELNEDGVIDEDVIKTFVCGHCHSFALTLHKKTGWPIVGFICEETNDTPNSPGHCAVYCPQLDDYIDVSGPGAFERYRDDNGDTEVKFFAVEEIPQFDGYLPLRTEVAEPFAETVLHELLDIHGEAVLQRDWRQYGTDRQCDSGPFQS